MNAASWTRSAALITRDIKLAHTVFAMPFALLGAAIGWSLTPDALRTPARAAGQFTLVVACTVAARTWAMVVNRMADRTIDAANPRTRKRAFASGDVATRSGLVALAVSAAVFMVSCAMFGVLFGNWWPAALGAPVLGWVGLYSFTKRWTWLCHMYLGSALAVSPLAAALAAPGLWWIAAMVLCWVAGFDVIYSLQDLDFDRGAGLRSVPARFGWRGAVALSRGLHLLSLAALVVALVMEPLFGVLTAAGVVVVAVVLVAEHLVLARRGKEGIPMAFFTLNGVVSLVLCTACAIDVLT